MTRSPSGRLEADGLAPGTSRFVRESLNQALRAPFLRSLLRVPLKKVAIWVSFLGLLYLLREFFGLMFLTFVITYITNTIVTRITPYFTNRKVPVVLVFACILGVILGVGWMTVPRAVRQGKAQLDKMKRVEDPKLYFQKQLAGLLKLKFPEQASVEAIGTGARSATQVKPPRFPGQDPHEDSKADPTSKTDDADSKTGEATKTGEEAAAGEEVKHHDDSWLGTVSYYLTDPEINKIVAENMAEFWEKVALPRLKQLVVGIWAAFVYLMLALLFSFLIMWDMPKLAAGISDLEHSRLGDVWHQVAPSIATFFRLLGHAFEAQTVIALMNTALTAMGMMMLGIPGIGILSVIVFLCSYIPILGMWISTLPICVMALQSPDGGLVLIALVVLMISVVHAVEAYVLNPRIYGYHMKMHPLAVLVVLYLGQHLVGMWGLIIGVPLATYVWRHLILGQEEYIYAPASSHPPPSGTEPPAQGAGGGAVGIAPTTT